MSDQEGGYILIGPEGADFVAEVARQNAIAEYARRMAAFDAIAAHNALAAADPLPVSLPVPVPRNDELIRDVNEYLASLPENGDRMAFIDALAVCALCGSLTCDGWCAPGYDE